MTDHGPDWERERGIAVGDTVYAVAGPETLRRLDAAAVPAAGPVDPPVTADAS